MIVIEMREAAREKAFDLIDEANDLRHQQKLIMCELEDTLYDCFDDDSEEEESEKSDEGTDLGFKKSYNRNYAMRNFDEEDKMDERPMHRYRRSMRMRRNRMRRY